MRIAIVAFSVRGAMGQYVHCLGEALGAAADVSMHVPTHFEYRSASYQRSDFVTGRSQRAAALRLLNLWLGARLWRRILSRNPDCVHIFNGEGYPWAQVGVSACRRRGIPVLVSVHDAKAHSGSFVGMLNERLRRGVLRNANALHVHTAEAAGQVSCVAPNVPVHVIRHGDISPVFTRFRDGTETRERHLALFFGRLESYKGIDQFLLAARLLDRKWRFVIAGPGRIGGDIATLVGGISPDRIEVVNRYLSDSDVAALLGRASVAVLPYRDATQSSLPSLCAAFALPVVANRVGGLIEDVPLVGGLLVTPGDTKELAAGIEAAENITPCLPEELRFGLLKSEYLLAYSSMVGGKLGS